MSAIRTVAIVGAGPTGLALGMELRRRGEDVVILDRLEAGKNTSRAAVIHARTMEVLEPSGVTARLLDEGIRVAVFKLRERSREVMSISFADLKTKYNYALMCPQNRTEARLRERYEEMGGETLRPCEVQSVVEEESVVRIGFVRNGETEEIQARWVVGCDGMHSRVREMSGISFAGAAYEESFVLADVQMDWPWERDEVGLFLSKDGPVIVAPLPEDVPSQGGSRFRIVATVPVAEEHPVMEHFQQILDERGPDGRAARIWSMEWSSRFHVHHRVASRLRQGHLLIAGDAAHVHSPAGGQGMNTGIQDAVALAEALQVAAKQGNEDALDAWEHSRLKIAEDVVALTDRLMTAATLQSPLARGLRNAVMSVVGSSHFMQHAIAEKMSELDNR